MDFKMPPAGLQLEPADLFKNIRQVVVADGELTVVGVLREGAIFDHDTGGDSSTTTIIVDSPVLVVE